jgi:hypothetical protein
MSPQALHDIRRKLRILKAQSADSRRPQTLLLIENSKLDGFTKETVVGTSGSVPSRTWRKVGVAT